MLAGSSLRPAVNFKALADNDLGQMVEMVFEFAKKA
jgi:hypothetical protein